MRHRLSIRGYELEGLRKERFEKYASGSLFYSLYLSNQRDRIKSRLLELDYSAVDIDCHDFKWNLEVTAPKPVTDRSESRYSPFVSCHLTSFRRLDTTGPNYVQTR